MKQIVLKSFTDFLIVRTVANKYTFREHIEVQKMQVAQLFLSEVSLVFDSNKVPQLQQVEKQLRKEDITLTPYTPPFLTPTPQTAPISDHMQTFDQLTTTIFHSMHRCCLLIVELPSQATVLKEIHQKLFTRDEEFSIEQVKKGSSDTYAGDWFFIKHEGSAVPDGQPVFHCDGLIKPNLTFRLNMRKAVKIYNLRDHQARLEVQISKFTRLAYTSELFLKIDDLMAMHLKMSFKSIDGLFETLRMIYGHGFKDCIEFVFPEEEGPPLQYHEFVQIYPTLSNRIDKFEQDFNVSFRNHHPKRIQSSPPPPIELIAQRAQAPLRIQVLQREAHLQPSMNVGRITTQAVNREFQTQLPMKLGSRNRGQQPTISPYERIGLPQPNKIVQPTPPIEQQPEHVEALRIKTILLQGKHRDILALQQEWPAISQFFTELISNWSINHTYAIGFLKTITKIMDYRLHKFRMPLPKQPVRLQKVSQMTDQDIDAEVQSSFFYLNTHIYPKMRQFVQKFGLLLNNMKTIKDKAKEKYSEYKKIAKNEEQAQRQRLQQGGLGKDTNLKSYDLKSKKERLEERFEQYNKILNIILQDCRKDLGKQGYEENVLDKLMLDYFAELQSLSKGKGYFYVKIQGFQKKELREFIGEIIGFQEKFFDWQDVFNIIILNIHPDKLIGSGVQKLLSSVNTTVYSDTSCLGCAQYFVLNRSIINKHNRIPLRVFSQGSIGKRLRGQFMEDVCTMLNNSGGIILFNCNKYYGSVLPKGAYLTNRDKARYIEEIEEMIGQIYPKVQLNKQIVVSFVPIVIKSESMHGKAVLKKYEQQERRGQYYQAFSKIEGFYIMRIKIVPQHKSKVYIWGTDEQYNLNGVANQYKKLKISQLYRAIKLRLSQYPQATSFRPRTYGNPLSHQCKIIKEEPKKEDQYDTNIKQNLERRYKFISMIVVKEQNINKIDAILKDEGFDIFIKPVFQEYRFGIAKYTAALFHNEAFSEILQFFINCKELVFDGKRVLSIFITDYLKIDTTQGLNSTDIKNACEWLRKEFPHQEMKYFQAKSLVPATPKAYYIKTETKLSTLFMYYVFNHYKTKTVFKNPPNTEIDKLQSIKLNERN